MKSRYSFLSLLILIAPLWAQVHPVINHAVQQWDHPEILISQDNQQWLKPGDFCLALLEHTSEIRNPKCRNAGDWEQDSLFQNYRRWLSYNLEQGVEAQDLKARSSSVLNRLQELDDQKLLILFTRQDTLWAAWFSGYRSTENSALVGVPFAAGYLVPQAQKSKEIARSLVQTWFQGKRESKLSKEQKRLQALRPNATYAENHPTDFWIGAGVGRSQAHIPLTPDNWTQQKIHSSIRNYRIVADSLSLWNFVEDKALLQTLYMGFIWNGFIGMEAFAHRSVHDAKLADDSIYQELDSWSFTRWEIGITGIITTPKPIGSQLIFYPFIQMGFHYSFWQEHIKLKEGYTASNAMENRIKLEPFYKGALFAIGSRIIWNRKIGFQLRAGLNNRGLNLNQGGNTGSGAEETTIGGSTLDAYITTSLEYHWQL